MTRNSLIAALRSVAGKGLLVLIATAPGSAQSPPTPPAPPTAPGGGGAANVVQDSSANLYTEWGVALAGTAAAVYAVCRSSRRL